MTLFPLNKIHPSSDAPSMKHLKDAQQLYMQGNSAKAMEIIDNILGLSPKNTEALRLKAQIVDSWGHFDESFMILQHMVKINPNDESIVEDLSKRIEEDRESLIYSKLTVEGRWYFSFSPTQIFVSIFGLVGCILFLISSPMYFEKKQDYLFLGITFFVLVVLPWGVLLILNFKGVKKILVGINGIEVFRGFKRKIIAWEKLGFAVIEYDTNLINNHLKLILYSKITREPLIEFDISEKSSDVFARRHFVRLILSYVDVISYIPVGKPLTTEGLTVNQNQPKNNDQHNNAA